MIKVLAVMVLMPVLSLGVVASASAQSEEAPVVARLVTRNRVVLIRSGEQGTQYTVKTEKGEVLDANLSDRDFQAKHPDIYERIKPAIARPDANSPLIPWAGL